MLVICMKTFRTENLNKAIFGLSKYKEPFRLIINNDNPDEKITEKWTLEYIQQMCPNCKELYILETDVNLGMFIPIWRLMHCAINISHSNDYMMLMDDDDIIMNPDLTSGADILVHKFGVSEDKKVTDLLFQGKQISELPAWEDGYPKNFHNEAGFWHATGLPIKISAARDFYDFITNKEDLYEDDYMVGVLTPIYEIYGSRRILDRDDVIFCVLLRKYAEYANLNVASIPTYSYVCICDEPRKGRYEVSEFVPDSRYGYSTVGDKEIITKVQQIIDTYTERYSALNDN